MSYITLPHSNYKTPLFTETLLLTISYAVNQSAIHTHTRLRIVVLDAVGISHRLFLNGKVRLSHYHKDGRRPQNYIDESLQKAHEANQRLAGIQQESERILNEARAKQAEILAQAKATSDSMINEARKKAQNEGAQMLQEAKTQIAAEKRMHYATYVKR